MSDSFEQCEQPVIARFKARFAVFYGTEREQRMTDYAVNISTGGIFLETGTILPVDTPLLVEFTLPGKEIPITCNAKVSWTNGPVDIKKSILPPGMGIQFLDLSLENLRAIRDFLSKGNLLASW